MSRPTWIEIMHCFPAFNGFVVLTKCMHGHLQQITTLNLLDIQCNKLNECL